jgi:hypothetical protein
MNLSPEWAESPRESGLDAIHWSRLGEANAPDHKIFERARTEGLIILTQDLDFPKYSLRQRQADQAQSCCAWEMNRIPGLGDVFSESSSSVARKLSLALFW